MPSATMDSVYHGQTVGQSDCPPSKQGLSDCCFWCLSPEASPCSHCQLAACDSHWQQHRSQAELESQATAGGCFPVRVEQHPTLGRRLIAVRDIRRAEVLLEDRPSALGPVHTTTPLCLECAALLPVPSYGCPYCGFPLCGEGCARGARHEAECDALTKAKQKVKITKGDRPAVEYQAIMLIRLLLGDPAELARTDLLSDHVDKLTKQEREVYGAGVVKVIQGLKIGNWTQEQLFRYISIIRTNASAVPEGSGRGNLRILHPSLATANHSCLVNSRVHQRLDHSIVMRAQRDIRQGEEVTNRYTAIFQGRLGRETALSWAWHFSCTCPRCTDPTDLGAQTDSLLCTRGGCGGLMLPGGGQGWGCNKCDFRRSRAEVEEVDEGMKEAIASRAANLPALEALLLDQASTFHTNHHLMVTVKAQVVLEYSRLMEAQARGGKSWSLKQVRRKVELCRQVLEVLDLIDPGLSDTRGQMLNALVAPQLVLLQHGLRTGKVQKVQVQEGMKELVAMIEDVILHLEVFEEGREVTAVMAARQLLQDSKAFQEQAAT